MAPAINHEVAMFLPRNAVAAAAGELLGGIAGAYAAGRALSQAAAAAGRETIVRQGARILTMNSHALTGSSGSAVFHAFADAGVDVAQVSRAVARDIGDLSRLSPGLQRGSVTVGERIVDYSRYTQPTGETSMNFWLRPQ
jgi:hypothetical protein